MVIGETYFHSKSETPESRAEIRAASEALGSGFPRCQPPKQIHAKPVSGMGG